MAPKICRNCGNSEMSMEHFTKCTQATQSSHLEPENEEGMECGVCHKKKLSVSNRPDAFANDVGNNPDARHTVCDECDYQNCMDI